MSESHWARETARLEREARTRDVQNMKADMQLIQSAKSALLEMMEPPPDTARQIRELRELGAIAADLRELRDELIVGASGRQMLYSARQSAASGKFLAKEAASGDGWTWPVKIMASGWASGVVEGSGGLPHYFPREVVAQVAEAANGVRFRRRHPEDAEGDGSAYPELTAGWISNSRVSGSAAVATVNLLKNASDVRSMLMAAQEAGKLDLYGVSIFGYFGFQKSQVEGKPGLVATSLKRFVGLDMCAEPGAGGRFLHSSGGA